MHDAVVAATDSVGGTHIKFMVPGPLNINIFIDSAKSILYHHHKVTQGKLYAKKYADEYNK